MSPIAVKEDQEVQTTIRWSFGILMSIVIQTAGFAWWASALSADVKNNAQDIRDLRIDSSIIVTRDQIDDILLSRDNRIDTIEATVTRIEQKVDNLR